MSEERIHHDFSPSTLQAREASPCFHPRNEQSEASRLGTKQHKAYETGDFSGMTDEQCEAVETCINYSNHIFEAMRSRYAHPLDDTPSLVTRLDETYLAVDDEETTAGYIDRAYISPDLAEADLLDCKFGKWPVEPAETNLQGICYALGLRQRYPTLQRIGVHFLCPYLGYVDSFNFTGGFEDMLFRVRAVVARAKEWKRGYEAKEPVKWHPTTGSCLFCARIGVCEAAHAIALKISSKYAPLALPTELTPELLNDPKQATLLMQAAELMKTWGESARRTISNRVIDGLMECPEGYRVVEGMKRPIKDTAKCKTIAKEEFGLTEADIEAASTLKITGLKKAVSGRAPRGSKTEAVEHFCDRLTKEGVLADGKSFAYLKMIKPDDDNSPEEFDDD